METVIDTKHLTKSYGKNRGINDVSITVNKGDVYGFLGPNGAGKSTTIRTLLDLIRPDSGTASIFGLDCRRDALAIRRRIGHVPGDVSMYGFMTAEKFLAYCSEVRGRLDAAAAHKYAQRFDVRLDRKLREYSKGNRQKIALVQAFMSDPELVIMDEPTSGLDPLVQQTFLEVIREEAKAGRTIFLSSHMLPEVEKVCNRVAIIREGRLVIQDSIEGLRKRSGQLFDVRFGDEVPPESLKMDGVSSVVRHDGHTEMIVTGNVGNVLREVASRDVEEITIRPMSLEDIFLQYYTAGGVT